MLARHDALATVCHKAAVHPELASLAGEKFDLTQGQLGRKPHGSGSRLMQGAQAGHVVHGNRVPQLGRGTTLVGKHQLGDVADGNGLARTHPRIQARVVRLSADLVQNRDATRGKDA